MSVFVLVSHAFDGAADTERIPAESIDHATEIVRGMVKGYLLSDRFTVWRMIDGKSGKALHITGGMYRGTVLQPMDDGRAKPSKPEMYSNYTASIPPRSSDLAQFVGVKERADLAVRERGLRNLQAAAIGKRDIVAEIKGQELPQMHIRPCPKCKGSKDTGRTADQSAFVMTLTSKAGARKTVQGPVIAGSRIACVACKGTGRKQD